jgi:hypothetical protein
MRVLLHALLTLGLLGGEVRPSFAREAAREVEPREDEDTWFADLDEEEDEEGLQQRLTEREDKRRPLEPYRTRVFGNLLTLGGEYELETAYVRPLVLEPEVDGKVVREPDRWLMSNELQLEAFYSIGKPLSMFVQFQAIWEKDLLGRTFEGVSDTYLERGEMWLYSEDLFGSGVSVDVGRLDFEDDRRWWWDDERDAARIAWEGETVELTLALAYELGSDRLDRSWVDPEEERVLRWISENSWDFSENHSFQLFLVHQDDHSPTERVGDRVAVDREDDSDARLTWLGARLTGIFDRGSSGLFGYWIDAAAVRGEDTLIEFGDREEGKIEAEEVSERDVQGWAFDVGGAWLLPFAIEPRVFAGYAYGSGDATSGGDDRAFRQTGLEGNEAGFGGVERFNSYGLLLQPELSNIHIVTAGVGLSLLRSSSLDLVYHYYRLDEPADELRDSLLEAELDGVHEKLGWGVDLVLAVEEWERFEFDVAASVLRTGPAFLDEPRRWVVGGFLAVRYAF